MPLRLLLLLLIVLSPTGCESEAKERPIAWSGSVDTLASGQIVVRNPAEPLWAPGGGWRIVEELRIGTLEGDGPDLFGRITSLAVDPVGRIWILDGQAQELRVFDADGSFIRTVGRRGAGPGEFSAAVHVALGPDQRMYVMDPANQRISVVDTAGVFVDAHWTQGGFIVMPWPGGFDSGGRYISPAPRAGGAEFQLSLVRHDRSFASADTIPAPVDPKPLDFFEADGMRALVPFQGGLIWRVSPAGSVWGLLPGEYRLFEMADNGDTIRTVSRAFTTIPVTSQDRQEAVEGMKYFVDRGGRVDGSRIPSTKPPVTDFFFDDESNVWVQLQPARGESRQRRYDVFEPEGRYLGAVEIPYALASRPLIRDGTIYFVMRDAMDVQYVVRGRIE